MFKIFRKNLDAPRTVEAALCIAIAFLISTVIAEALRAPRVLVEILVICILASALTGLVAGMLTLPIALRNMRRAKDSDAEER